MTEIERRQAGAVQRGFEGATVTDTALVFDADITTDRAEEIASTLGRIDRSAKWWLGDWVRQYALLRGGGAPGMDAALHVGAEMTGYGEGTLSNWYDVTERIPLEDRDERLDFSTWIELGYGVRDGLTLDQVREIRDRLIEAREQARLRGGSFPNHKVAREIVREALASRGITERLFHFPTTDEQIAEQSAEIVRLRTELEDLQLSSGTHVRCPMCRTVSPRELAQVGRDA